MSSKTKWWRLEIELLRRGRGGEKKVGAVLVSIWWKLDLDTSWLGSGASGVFTRVILVLLHRCWQKFSQMTCDGIHGEETPS